MNILKAVWAVLSVVLTKFGGFFKQIIKDGETTYETLETEAQQAGHYASGILAVVNNDLNKIPSEVVTDIKRVFPAIDLDVVHGFVETLLNKTNMYVGEIPVTLEDAIGALQKVLQRASGDNTFWGHLSKFLAGELAILYSPETPIQKFDDSLEYIFHLIIKPHVATVLGQPVSPVPIPEKNTNIVDPEAGATAENTGASSAGPQAPDTEKKIAAQNEANTAPVSEAAENPDTNTAEAGNGAEAKEDAAPAANLSFDEAQQQSTPPPPQE